MGLSRQEYWNGLSCPPLGDLPDPGMEPVSLTSPALEGGFFTTSANWEVSYMGIFIFKFHQIVQLKCVPFKKIMGQQSCLGKCEVTG